jgi:hypothetical protein
MELWYPIGKDMHNQVRLLGVIAFQMHRKIVRTIHTFMHHEYAGFYRGAFARIENHRTDGQVGWSATF